MAEDYTRQQGQNPWLKPAQPVKPGSTQPTADRYAEQYIPNEPDSNEPMYAAQAAAARQRAQDIRTAALTQQAAIDEQAAEAASHAVVESLYRQDTGIARPAADADAAALQGDEQPRRRRRMVVRQEDGNVTVAPMPEAPTDLTDTARRRTQAILAAQQEQEMQDESLRKKAEAAKQEAREKQTPGTYTPVQQPQAEQTGSKVPEKAKKKLGAFHHRKEEAEVPLLVNSSPVPFGLPSDVEWDSERMRSVHPDEDEELAQEDQMDSQRMPKPAPVPTFEVPAAPAPKKKGTGLLTLLIIVMVLVALCSALWLSGLGKSLWEGAVDLYTGLTTETIKTGDMSVVPEAAAVPTTLTVTLTTDNTIADLRLVDDAGQMFDATVMCTSYGDTCLWSCRMAIEEPYSGFVHAQLLTRSGEWLPGSSSRYVSID